MKEQGDRRSLVKIAYDGKVVGNQLEHSRARIEHIKRRCGHAHQIQERSHALGSAVAPENARGQLRVRAPLDATIRRGTTTGR